MWQQHPTIRGMMTEQIFPVHFFLGWFCADSFSVMMHCTDTRPSSLSSSVLDSTCVASSKPECLNDQTEAKFRTFDRPCKIRGATGKMPESVLEKLSRCRWMFLIYVSPFRNHSASEETGVENRGQISHFLPPCTKLRKRDIGGWAS